ncbi:Panacea domain-containing protein [Allobaculum sp. JKK-2023]|uniref:Panacea domain-containing protein n=1 Tax=Allobaculum sp. JKK-2023 TaxID=3108943 RepID=UPI002B059941|nr:type II toxin-antitoxin system antitoxin SocA domain-containing protein [Allobaculum sp. JKK-2023]
MATVFDVATYILEKKGSLSAMKLQKLCYYAQAWSLVWDGKELFPEEFEAWKNGPVCRPLYIRTRGKFLVSKTDENGNSDRLTQEQKDTVNSVLDYYGDKDAQWLSRLTHMEDPWKNARAGYNDGDHCEEVISKASMAEYYESL